MKPPLHAPKRRGEWVELQFMARAHAHGLIVSKPWGDSARYDFIVECPPSLRCHPERTRKRESKDLQNAKATHSNSSYSGKNRETTNEKSETARFHRVQVKSTFQRPKGCDAYLCNTTSRGPLGDHYAYSPNQVDFFAFFVIPEDIWYIVPITELRRTRFAAYLNPYQPKNKYFRYMEAWHLLQK